MDFKRLPALAKLSPAVILESAVLFNAQSVFHNSSINDCISNFHSLTDNASCGQAFDPRTSAANAKACESVSAHFSFSINVVKAVGMSVQASFASVFSHLLSPERIASVFTPAASNLLKSATLSTRPKPKVLSCTQLFVILLARFDTDIQVFCQATVNRSRTCEVFSNHIPLSCISLDTSLIDVATS